MMAMSLAREMANLPISTSSYQFFPLERHSLMGDNHKSSAIIAANMISNSRCSSNAHCFRFHCEK